MKRTGIQDFEGIFLAGLLGGTAAVEGWMLSAGGARFVLAFITLGGFLLAAGRWLGGQRAQAATLRLTLRAGLFSLLAATGMAAGMLVLGASEADSWSTRVVPGLAVGLAALAGATAFLAGGRPRSVQWAAGGLVLVIGAAGGAISAQYVSWATARHTLWGALSGTGLLCAVSGLLLPPQDRSSAKTESPQRQVALLSAIAIVLIGSGMPRLWNDTGSRNLYTHQARAFLNGRLDIGLPRDALADVAYFGDKGYALLPPFPAILLLPVVWGSDLAGSAVPMRLVSALLTALSATLLNGLLASLQVATRHRYWIVAGFVFGTGLWFTTLSTDDSGRNFAHDVAVLCLLLAMVESFGRRRGLLVGALLGMAALSRPTAILAGLFLSGLLVGGEGRQSLRRLAGLVGGLSFWLILYLLFNYSRFGELLDAGFTANLHPPGSFLSIRLEQYGPFSPAYVWHNLYYFFLHGFNLLFKGATLLKPGGMDQFGTSVAVASPFLLLAFGADWPRPRQWLAWAAIGLTLLTHVFYFNNGYPQINTQRYMLDYLPLLILLVGRAAGQARRFWLEAAIAYSIGLNLLALFLAQ